MSRYTTHTVTHGLQIVRCRKTLWQMMKEVFAGNYKMSFLTSAVAIVAVAYIIFPFDILPDYIPVLGWIDDGLIIYLVLKRLAGETRRYNRFKAMERKDIR